MIGVRRYQQKQCKRLAKPKDILDVIKRSNNHLTRSLNDLNEGKGNLTDSMGKINFQRFNRTQTRAEKASSSLNSERENKFSRSSYDSRKKIANSERKLNNSLDKLGEVKYNTIVQDKLDNPQNSYIHKLESGKRNVGNNLLGRTHSGKYKDNADYLNGNKCILGNIIYFKLHIGLKNDLTREHTKNGNVGKNIGKKI